MAKKLKILPNLTYNNVSGTFMPLVQGIIIIGRKVNELVIQHNLLVDELKDLKENPKWPTMS